MFDLLIVPNLWCRHKAAAVYLDDEAEHSEIDDSSAADSRDGGGNADLSDFINDTTDTGTGTTPSGRCSNPDLKRC